MLSFPARGLDAALPQPFTHRRSIVPRHPGEEEPVNFQLAVPDHAGVDQTERHSLRLFTRLHHPATGESERRRLRDEIIECNLPFVTRLAHRYRHRGQDGDDLAQAAAYALVKAVDSFDPARGKPFFGYLTPCVMGELKRHFRDKAWAMHVSRRLQELHLDLRRHQAALTQRWGRSPTVTELADAMDVTDDEVVEALAVGQAYRPESLNAHATAEHDSAERQDFLGAQDPRLTSLCDHLALRDLLHRLPERERSLINRYFYEEATQEQIAGELGMSQMNVSRLLRRILRDLRRQLEGADERPPRPARSGVRIITYPAARRDQVVVVAGDLDNAAVGELSDLLVDIAVQDRPRRIVVDLRRLGSAGGSAVRAFVDGYRAGGHSGAGLVLINTPRPFLELLVRLGAHRLFPCVPAGRPAAVPDRIPAHPGAGTIRATPRDGLRARPSQRAFRPPARRWHRPVPPLRRLAAVSRAEQRPGRMLWQKPVRMRGPALSEPQSTRIRAGTAGRHSPAGCRRRTRRQPRAPCHRRRGYLGPTVHSSASHRSITSPWGPPHWSATPVRARYPAANSPRADRRRHPGRVPAANPVAARIRTYIGIDGRAGG
ncbi:SigB/SigF/SigG family RNA polymerase sigma factor [Actinoplanes sp. NPDC026619]|uniref:SigB/SigF/SigG family RNA polymerase sigma factor n=1 Tax=Actinoplanes sp. NPDC026619 TaxID=3155798 RepID=UPI0033F298EF